MGRIQKSLFVPLGPAIIYYVLFPGKVSPKRDKMSVLMEKRYFGKMLLFDRNIFIRMVDELTRFLCH